MGFFNSRLAKTQSVCVLLSVCFIGLIVPADAKKATFNLPSSDKLTDGEGPQSAPVEKVRNTSLAPVGLHDEEKASADATASDGDEANALLKSSVSQNDFAAKAKAGSGEKNSVATGKNESVIDKKGLSAKLAKDKKPEAPYSGPISLMPGEEEENKTAETIIDSEKRQMGELWQCTIDRNPDIQFVIQKLQPSSDANHAMASTMKVLSQTLFGAMNMAPMMMMGGGGFTAANQAAMMGIGSGSNMIQGLFQDKAQKAQKKQAISQEQATILYKIVRDTADKLVASYRDYKKEQATVFRASADLQDLQAMVAESRHTQDPAKQIDMEYTLRKAKRDIEEKSEQSRLYRQQLADLAGVQAIDKLDKEMEDERNAIANITGTGTNSDPGAGVAKDTTEPVFKNPLPQLNASKEVPKSM